MKPDDFLNKSKLYKMRLEGREQLSIFDECVGSDNRELFIRAMDNDLHKISLLRFEHPRNKEKVFYRRYVLCPANGNTLMVVGQFRDPMDFAYVIIVLNSKNYKESYMVIERYSRLFRNPDMLAEMVANAFNQVLKEVGVKVTFEPWDTRGKVVTYLEDGWKSYNIELFNSQGRNLIRMGYEDALEVFKKEVASGESSGSRKSDDIRAYIWHQNKKAIVDFLHHAVKGMMTPKEIAMPFRFVYDHHFTDHIPYKAVIKAFPELKDLISERKYNDWTNKNSTSYDSDPRYEMLKDLIEMII